MGSRIVLPVVVRNKAVAAGAAWWIDALAEIVAAHFRFCVSDNVDITRRC